MKKHNQRRRGHSPTSTDGIIQNGRLIGVARPRAYQPTRQQEAPTLDNFIRRDGFHPLRQGSGSLNVSIPKKEVEPELDEPIILDELDEKKKKKLKFWQRHAKLKTGLKRTVLALFILGIASAGYFGYKLYHTQKKVLAGGGKAPAVCSDNVDTSQLSTEGDSRINVLLLGIGGEGHDGPDLTDTIMLASIDPITNKVALLSVPRDLWVKIPNVGYKKINAAYALAKEASIAKTDSGRIQDGLDAIDKTLQPILNVPIHYHAVVDFQAFKQTVDTVGGIDVNVPETLYDPTVAWENHWSPVIAKAGHQTFNGQQALLYVRSRETSSDFARGERQRLVLAALKQKVFTAGTFANPIKISSLLDSLGSNVYTDFNTSSIKCIYRQLSEIPNSAITSLDLVTPPNDLVTTDNIEGQSVVEPKAGLFEYDDIQAYVHKSLVDGLIAKENAKIAVYNATSTSGLATNVSNKLKSYGYNVATVDNAPTTTNPSSTTVVDLSKGVDKYTKHYLEKRFSVATSGKVPADVGITPPVGTNFVIILGNDASSSSKD